MLDDLIHDMRYGARMLFKRPGFTAIAVLTLALGIGANAAMFSVVNGVLLRPLPLQEPERLVMLWEWYQPLGWRGTVSPANFRNWRQQNQAFGDLTAYTRGSFNLVSGGAPAYVTGLHVLVNFFDVLRPEMILGRGFRPEEVRQGDHRVVVLSESFWRSQLAADPKILYRPLRLDGEEYIVVGITRRTEPGADLYVPISYSPQAWSDRGSHYLRVIGRLKPAVPVQAAQQHMDGIAAGLEQQYPDTNAGRRTLLVPLHEQIAGGIRPTLLLLLGAVGFVLLIACTNVANLLLARATSREREMAIRAALGAGRARLARQFLTEALILFLAGGAVALLLAFWGMEFLTALAADSLPLREQVALDGAVLAFTFGVAMLTGLLFSVFPALQVSRVSAQGALRERGTGATSKARNRARAALVVAEVAAAFVLLIGATLLLKSLLLVRSIDPGFRSENLLTARVSLADARYPEGTDMQRFYARVLERVAALPGVESVGLINYLPLEEWGINSGVQVEGREPLPAEEAPAVEIRLVNPEYFRTLGIPIMQGRRLTDQDGGDGPPVVLINQTLARRLWEKESPVGSRIRFGSSENPWATIVGVVADIKQAELTRPTRPELYVPYNHSLLSGGLTSMALVVRTPGDPRQITSALRREVRTVDPEQAVYSVRTMAEVVSRSLSDRQLSTTLLGTFAGLATLLAAIGIFGVMAYSVAQRTHEIGVRMALGAQPGHVLWMILSQGLGLAVLGVAVGFGASLGLGHLLQAMLYQLQPSDPLTLGLVAGLVLLVAMAACWMPARRATKVDPLVALRYE